MKKSEDKITKLVEDFLTELYHYPDSDYILSYYIPLVRNKEKHPKNPVYDRLAKDALKIEKITGKSINELKLLDGREAKYKEQYLNIVRECSAMFDLNDWRELEIYLNRFLNEELLQFDPVSHNICQNIIEASKHCEKTPIGLLIECRNEHMMKTVNNSKNEATSDPLQKEYELLYGQITNYDAFNKYFIEHSQGIILNINPLFEKVIVLSNQIKARNDIVIDVDNKYNALKKACFDILEDERFQKNQISFAINRVAYENNYSGFTNKNSNRDLLVRAISPEEILKIVELYLGSERKSNDVVADFQEQMIKEYKELNDVKENVIEQ